MMMTVVILHCGAEKRSIVMARKGASSERRSCIVSCIMPAPGGVPLQFGGLRCIHNIVVGK